MLLNTLRNHVRRGFSVLRNTGLRNNNLIRRNVHTTSGLQIVPEVAGVVGDVSNIVAFNNLSTNPKDTSNTLPAQLESYYSTTNNVVPSVKLVSYSQPSQEFESEGVDDVQELIAFCARVSNPTNQMNSKTSKKLINYLIKHKHWSPLEMVSACIEINTTRDIARQILRHRSFSFQEFSQRYANPAEFGDQFVVRDARLQDPKNRQNSVDTDDYELQRWWTEQQATLIYNVGKLYQQAVDRGIAMEQARAILPEGNTKSRLYMNGTIRSWIHYIDLRADNGTQKEHIEIARMCAQVISEIFPVADTLLGNDNDIVEV